MTIEITLNSGELNPYIGALQKKEPCKIVKNGVLFTQIEYALTVPFLKRTLILIKALAITLFTAFFALFSKRVRNIFAEAFTKNKTIYVLIPKEETLKNPIQIETPCKPQFFTAKAVMCLGMEAEDYEGDDFEIDYGTLIDCAMNSLISGDLINAKKHFGSVIKSNQNTFYHRCLHLRNLAKQSAASAKNESLALNPNQEKIEQELRSILACETMIQHLKKIALEFSREDGVVLSSKVIQLFDNEPISHASPFDPRVLTICNGNWNQLHRIKDFLTLAERRLKNEKPAFATQCVVKALTISPRDTFVYIDNYRLMSRQVSERLSLALDQNDKKILRNQMIEFDSLSKQFLEILLRAYDEKLPVEFYDFFPDPALCKLTEKNPIDVKALLNLARSHFYEGKKSAARQALTKAFSINETESVRFTDLQKSALEQINKSVGSDPQKMEKWQKHIALLNSFVEEAELVKKTK